VLAAIARMAAQLCDARDALVFRVEGDRLRVVAKHGVVRAVSTNFEPRPINRRSAAGCAILDKRTIHVRDLAVAARARFPESAPLQQGSGVRTVLVTPLLLDGAALGAIVIRRTRVRPFTAKQIALFKTFADQAVIAIENARLSRALEARNSD
jgi:GAF domain-containing protein